MTFFRGDAIALIQPSRAGSRFRWGSKDDDRELGISRKGAGLIAQTAKCWLTILRKINSLCDRVCPVCALACYFSSLDILSHNVAVCWPVRHGSGRRNETALEGKHCPTAGFVPPKFRFPLCRNRCRSFDP